MLLVVRGIMHSSSSIFNKSLRLTNQKDGKYALAIMHYQPTHSCTMNCFCGKYNDVLHGYNGVQLRMSIKVQVWQ